MTTNQGRLMYAWKKVQFKHLGPTTLHLQYEAVLLLCTSLFAAASLASVYRYSFGTAGDIRFIALVTLWSSRHLLHRLLCTTTCRCSCFFLRGYASQFLARFASAGQYFDIPCGSVCGGEPDIVASHAPVVGTHNGTAIGGLSGASDFGGSGGAGGSTLMIMGTHVPPHRTKFVRTFVLTPILAIWNYAKFFKTNISSRRLRRVEEELLSENFVVGGSGKRGDKHNSCASSHHYHANNHIQQQQQQFLEAEAEDIQLQKTQTAATLYRTLDNIWKRLPSVQFCLAFFTMSFLLLGQFYFTQSYFEARGESCGIDRDIISSSTGNSVGLETGGSVYKYGRGRAFSHHFMPQHHDVTDATSHLDDSQINFCGKQRHLQNSTSETEQGIYASADDRLLSRLFLGPPSTGRVFFHIAWVGTMASLVFYGRILLPIPDLVAGSAHSRKGKTEGRNTAGGGSSCPANKDVPWAEQFRSIASENRFHLHCKVAFIRIVENIYLCGIIPKSSFVCKATGHCEGVPLLWELPGLTGITGEKGGAMFDFLIQDHIAGIIVIFSTVLITALLLVAQIVALDKTCLATISYSSAEKNSVTVGSRRQEDLDSRRPKNKRSTSDMAHHHLSAFGFYLRAANDVFICELGHSSTSRIMYMSGIVQLICIGFLTTVCLGYVLLGRNCTSVLLCLFANVIATHFTMAFGLTNYEELDEMASSISSSVTRSRKIH